MSQRMVTRIQQFGLPSKVIQQDQTAIPELKAEQVLVKMLYAPINPSDLIPILGSYRSRISLPYTPGYEGLGEVIAVGRAKNQALIGKIVLPVRGEGTWQSHVITDRNWLIDVTQLDIPLSQASQLYINPLTAYIICKEHFQLNQDSLLVMNAGNSELSRLFAQLAHIFGFTYLPICRNFNRKEELLALGATEVLLEDGYFETVKTYSQTKKLFVIDCVGGKNGTALASLLSAQQKLLLVGLLSGEQIDSQIILQKQLDVEIFHLRHWNQRVTVNQWQKIVQELLDLVRVKKITLSNPAIIVNFENIQQALQLLETKQIQGKVLLKMN